MRHAVHLWHCAVSHKYAIEEVARRAESESIIPLGGPYSYYNLNRVCELDDFAWWARARPRLPTPVLGG